MSQTERYLWRGLWMERTPNPGGPKNRQMIDTEETKQAKVRIRQTAYDRSEAGRKIRSDYYAATKEKRLARQRLYAKKNRKKLRAAAKLIRDPLKFRARSRFNYALKRGYIVAQPCVVCGKPKGEGHHPDYSKPLEVIWLCRLHHEHVHLGKITLPAITFISGAAAVARKE